MNEKSINEIVWGAPPNFFSNLVRKEQVINKAMDWGAPPINKEMGTFLNHLMRKGREINNEMVWGAPAQFS